MTNAERQEVRRLWEGSVLRSSKIADFRWSSTKSRLHMPPRREGQDPFTIFIGRGHQRKVEADFHDNSSPCPSQRKRARLVWDDVGGTHSGVHASW